MTSDEIKSKIIQLGIDSNNPNVIRWALEDLLDENAEHINTKNHNKYSEVEEIYSEFMETFVSEIDSNN